MKRKDKVRVTKIKIDLRILAVLFVSIFLINYYLRNFVFVKFVHVKSIKDVETPIWYTRIECFNNYPTITFYNPNNSSLENISLIFGYKGSRKIYNVVEPLPSKTMKSLVLNYSTCDEIKTFKDIRIRWCCLGRCYEVSYNTSETFNPMTTEKYSLEKCKNLSGVKKLFCYADVAEITNNITICYLIHDNDISSLCFAQLTLNESMCDLIKDIKLKEACIDSVRTKIKWASGNYTK